MEDYEEGMEGSCLFFLPQVLICFLLEEFRMQSPSSPP